MTSQRWQQLLAGEVAKHYRSAGKFAYHFAKNKVRYDSLSRDVFAAGLNIDSHEAEVDLLDLGAGQGLLAMAMLTAQRLHAQGQWPQVWVAKKHLPLRVLSCHGIEYSAANVARAQSAFAELDPQHLRLSCVQGNIVNAPYPTAKTIALIDVLHYLNYAEQEQVLLRVRSVIAPQGQLLLRVGDAEARQSNRISQQIDRVVSRWRGTDNGEICCRGLSQWLLLLKKLGFVPRITSSVRSTFFSNVMIVAELPQ